MNLIKITLFIFLIIGSAYFFIKYILKGYGWGYFIGCNSMVAATNILSNYIPKQHYLVFNVGRFIFILITLSLAYFIRKLRP